MTGAERLTLSPDGNKAYNMLLAAKEGDLLAAIPLQAFNKFFPDYLDPPLGGDRKKMVSELKKTLQTATTSSSSTDSGTETKKPGTAWGNVLSPVKKFDAKPDIPKPGLLSAEDATNTWQEMLTHLQGGSLSASNAPSGPALRSLQKPSSSGYASILGRAKFQTVLHWHPNQKDPRPNKLHYKYDTSGTQNHRIFNYQHWLLKKVGITQRAHLIDAVNALNGGKKLL